MEHFIVATGGVPRVTLRTSKFIGSYCQVLVQEVAALIKMRVNPVQRGFYCLVLFVPATMLEAVASMSSICRGVSLLTNL